MGLKRVRHLDDRLQATLQSFVKPAGKEALAFADIGPTPKIHKPQSVVISSRRPQVLHLEEIIELFEPVYVEFVGVVEPDVAGS